jgi:hypothetical protein
MGTGLRSYIIENQKYSKYPLKSQYFMEIRGEVINFIMFSGFCFGLGFSFSEAKSY